MIRQMRLENFKAFGRTQQFPLRRLTLIYGPNSSGKSSIIQALLLLKQTIQESTGPEEVLVPTGRLVDLGNFAEFVHRHDTERWSTIGIDASPLPPESLPPVWQSGELAEAMKRVMPGVSYGSRQQDDGVDFRLRLLLPENPTPLLSWGPAPENEDGPDAWTSSALIERFLKVENPDLDALVPEVMQLLVANLRREFAWCTTDAEKGLLAEQFRRGEVSEEDHQQIRALLQAFSRDPVDTWCSFSEEVERISNEGWKRFLSWAPRLSGWDPALLKDMKDTSTLSSDVFDGLISERIGANGLLPFPLPVRFRRWNGLTSVLEEDESQSPVLGEDKIPSILANELAVVTIQRFAALGRSLRNLTYLGPLRERLRRYHEPAGRQPRDVGVTGERLVEVLVGDETRLVEVNEWAARLGLGYRLKVHEWRDEDVSGMPLAHTVRLEDPKNGVSVSPLDVGVGVSQVLPIVIQALADRDQILCVEQPELHVHPRIQAELGGFLAHVAKSRPGNQVLVETHSEHLILRLQRMIRRGEISPEEVAVLYVCPGDEGALVLELRLDDNGEFLDRWPDGFFDEDFKELFGE